MQGLEFHFNRDAGNENAGKFRLQDGLVHIFNVAALFK
jgi:hypothetical protein